MPSNARFKAYRDVVVQGLVIKAHNTRYRLASWLTHEGTDLTGQLPASVQGHHFDPNCAATFCTSTAMAMWHNPCCWSNSSNGA